MYLGTVFLGSSKKIKFKQKLSARVDQMKIKNSWKKMYHVYVFKLWPMINDSRKL